MPVRIRQILSVRRRFLRARRHCQRRRRGNGGGNSGNRIDRRGSRLIRSTSTRFASWRESNRLFREGASWRTRHWLAKTMRMKTTRVLMLGLMLALGLRTVTAAEEWEIEPQPDARLKAGKLSVVGGELDGEPVQFVLKNLSLSQPIEVVL